MIGVYCYEDTFKDNQIVYVGKDSNIARKQRHRDHTNPSKYNAQKINRILQNNPGRYKYKILKQWEKSNKSPWLADVVEILYIRRHNPKFNFTIGGDGARGCTPWNKGVSPSEETRKKISEANKGRQAWNKGKTLSDEYRKKLSDAHKGIPQSEESKRKKSESLKGRTRPDEVKKKISQTKKANLDKISGANNPRYNTNVPDPLDLLEEYENGELSQKELGEKYGTTAGAIYYRIKVALKMKGENKDFKHKRRNPPKYKGENHPQYKQHIPAPMDLLKEYEEGLNIPQLSEKYNCSTSTIHRRINKARRSLI